MHKSKGLIPVPREHKGERGKVYNNNGLELDPLLYIPYRTFLLSWYTTYTLQLYMCRCVDDDDVTVHRITGLRTLLSAQVEAMLMINFADLLVVLTEHLLLVNLLILISCIAGFYSFTLDWLLF